MTAIATNASTIREFLTWLDAQPRTYADTMDAWQTSCPRFSAFEDAQIAGLVCIEPCRPFTDSRITLTAAGRAVLGERAQ